MALVRNISLNLIEALGFDMHLYQCSQPQVHRWTQKGGKFPALAYSLSESSGRFPDLWSFHCPNLWV